MLAPQGEQERAEPVTHGEGNRSGEEPDVSPNFGENSREELSGVGSAGCGFGFILPPSIVHVRPAAATLKGASRTRTDCKRNSNLRKPFHIHLD